MYLYKFDKTTQMCSKTLLNRVKFNWFKKKTIILSCLGSKKTPKTMSAQDKMKTAQRLNMIK